MDLYEKPSPMMRARRETQFDGPTDQTWLQAYGPPLLLIAASLLMLDGCRAIKGIFEAGVGVGVFAVVIVLAVIGGIAAMVARK
jgi:hypothetical protein